jgi:GNAT superfamily N-acetyltransferase
MGHVWPKETNFRQIEFVPEDRTCASCGARMQLCDHRHRRIFTLTGPVHIVSKLAHCPKKDCALHHKTFSSPEELSLALPWWAIGWDVLAWVGQRRFSRHWSIPQIRTELAETHAIELSDDALEDYVQRYQAMLAARHQDPRLLAQEYQEEADVILAFDGQQPEKGHETLYVIRELRRRRVWFAESLLSSAACEVRALLEKARDWAARLGKPGRACVSDKQAAFVLGVAEVFPGVPHRYCRNHFLRELAKPVQELDAHAKVQMRRKVRGLRAIEREVLAEAQAPAPEAAGRLPEPVAAEPARVPGAAEERARNAVVLAYCTAVRGILNDSQGGPLHPPGVRMAEALAAVHASVQRHVEAKKGGPQKSGWPPWRPASSAEPSTSKPNCNSSVAAWPTCSRSRRYSKAARGRPKHGAPSSKRCNGSSPQTGRPSVP